MTDKKQVLGRWGEDAAARYLKERGYEILERNYRTARGELDIIARRDDVLFFVEVKTRSSNRFGYPEDAVTARKQARMHKAAETYLENHPECPETWQFDILAITQTRGLPPAIEHFENVIT